LSRLQLPGFIRLSAAFLTLTVFGAGVLFALILGDAQRPVRNTHPPHISLHRASLRALTPVRSAQVTTRERFQLNIDATRAGAANPAGLRAARETLSPTDAPVDSGQDRASLSADAPGTPGVLMWARLDAGTAYLSWGADGPIEGLDAFASRRREGTTVVLSNRTPGHLAGQLRVRLPAATYKIERMTLTSRSESKDTGIGKDASLHAVNNNRSVNVTRLKGRDLTAPGVVTLPVDLQAGDVVAVRCTDVSYASRSALNEVRSQLERMPHASAELAHRLHVILDGTATCEAAISTPSRLTTDRRRVVIHRYLLVLSQAYSLHRNFQVRHTVKEQPGIDFQSALDQLKDSLADTSATLMGLVPGISVSLDQDQRLLRPVAFSSQDAPAVPAEHVAHVTVTLANQGSLPAELVKIGVNQNSLPGGVRCQPDEPALFGTVGPGETARATYELKWTGPASLPEGSCVGDISYFTAGAPAHLRPRTW